MKKNNLTLTGDVLEINYIYAADPYEVAFQSNELHRKAFNDILTSTPINDAMFFAERQLVKMYLW